MPRASLLFLTLSFLFILAALTGGFFIAGSPQDARAKKLDALRVGDLNRLSRDIAEYLRNNQALPASIDDLKITAAPNYKADPVSNAPYAYRRINDKAFELCAEFNSSQNRETDASVGTFEHPAGRKCFVFAVTMTNVNSALHYGVQMAP
ncbi:MAG: hypothetical protein OEL53_07575 [Rhodospirillales bacterium]|nr:hypothetical protein [Rhodospirillales bacterium]